MEDLTKSSLADQFQNLEILGSDGLLFSLLEMNTEVDFTRNTDIATLARFELKPLVIRGIIFDKTRAKPNMAQESFLIGSFVDGDVKLGVITNNVAREVKLVTVVKSCI